jgi:hypothetical protein
MTQLILGKLQGIKGDTISTDYTDYTDGEEKDSVTKGTRAQRERTGSSSGAGPALNVP